MSDLIPNVELPAGKVGSWVVEQLTVNQKDADFHNLREAIQGRGYRGIKPGTYTRLLRNGSVIMSDVPAEKYDHRAPVWKAKDHCIVNGLGLGMVVNAMLRKPEVTKVTVIEKSADVIALVSPYYAERYGERFEVIHADALEYKPPAKARYAVAWHDIWDSICADNLPQMRALHRKYGRRAEWQGSWCRYECERYNRAGY